MILTCPACSARYVVDPKALSPNGRMVRCAKCKHSWQEAPPKQDIPQVDPAEAEGPVTPDSQPHDPKPPAAKEPIPETKTVENPAPIIQDDDFAIARARRKKRPRPMPQGANLPALQNHNHGSSLLSWLGLVAFIMGIMGSFVFFQSTISEAWPPSQKLYRVLGMDQKHDAGSRDSVDIPHEDDAPKPENIETDVPLEQQFKIVDIVPNMETKGGVTTLTVQGNITNISDNTLSLPVIRISLKDDQGIILREWSINVDAATIISGEKIAIDTSLPNPPEDATSIHFSFIANK